MTTRWDDIVVGSGPTGACVARSLAEAGRRVLVVERGRAVSEPPGSHLRNRPDHRDDPDGWFAAVDAYLDVIDPDVPEAGLPGAATTSIVGGSGILWTNNCPRAVDGVDRPDRLETTRGRPPTTMPNVCSACREDEFGDSRRAEMIRTTLTGGLEVQGRRLTPIPLAGRRLSHDHVHYIAPADVLAATDATVSQRTGAVQRIELDGGRVIGVRVGDQLPRRPRGARHGRTRRPVAPVALGHRAPGDRAASLLPPGARDSGGARGGLVADRRRRPPASGSPRRPGTRGSPWCCATRTRCLSTLRTGTCHPTGSSRSRRSGHRPTPATTSGSTVRVGRA